MDVGDQKIRRHLDKIISATLDGQNGPLQPVAPDISLRGLCGKPVQVDGQGERASQTGRRDGQNSRAGSQIQRRAYGL